MPPTFSIRAATLADLPTILVQRHAMFEAMGYMNRAALELTDARFEEWVSEKLERGDYRGWFVSDEQGNVVAGAGLWIMDWPPHAIDQTTRRGNILNVYTDPEHRRLGLARLLAIHIMDFCRDENIRTVVIHPSDEGRVLYESLGFRPTGELRIQVTVPN